MNGRVASRRTSINFRGEIRHLMKLRKSTKFYTYGEVTPYIGTDWLNNSPAQKEAAVGLATPSTYKPTTVLSAYDKLQTGMY